MIQIIKEKFSNLVSDQKFTEILTGSVWAFSSRTVATAFGFAFSVIVARIYGAEVIGILAVMNSFLMLSTIFTVMGTPTSILRLIPEHLAKYSPTSALNVYRKTLYMVIGTSLMTTIIFFFSANLIADKVFSKPHLSYYFTIASFFIIFQSITILNTQAVRGLQLIKTFAVMLLMPQTFNLFFLIAVGLIRQNRDIPVYAIFFGSFMTGIIGWLIMEYSFKKRINFSDIVHTISRQTILSISLPMLMTSTMMFLVGQTGVLMLGIFCTEVDVGYYAIAVKLATMTTFVLEAVNSMAGPKFSELFYKGQIDDLFHVAKKSTKLIFITTTPILLILLIFGKFILGIIFGNKFLIVYPALSFLAIGQFVNSISGSSGTFLNMTGNQKEFRNIMMIVVVLNIGLNLWLIPTLGINGAAISAMISLSSWNIATLLYMKIKFGRTTGYFPFCG